MKLDKDNMCDICRNFFDNKDYIMHVDHCHTTNKVRGLLCHRCNVGLGYFKDRISYLKSATDYLIKNAPPDYYED